MYEINKDKGIMMPATIRNTETNAEINLGRPNIVLMSILEEAGYSTDPKGGSGVRMNDAWHLTVSKEIIDKVLSYYKLGVPPRAKTKEKIITTDSVNTKDENKKKIDALDIIFGMS